MLKIPKFSVFILSTALMLLQIETAFAMGPRIQNSSCSKANAKKTYNLVSLICTSVSGKLLWTANPVQNVTPIINWKSETFSPVAVFTSLPNSKLKWNQSLIDDALSSANGAFDWWTAQTKGKINFKKIQLTAPVTFKKANICDPRIQGDEALKILKLKSVGITSNVIVFSLDSQCQNGIGGIAENKGRFMIINESDIKTSDTSKLNIFLSTTIIAHEFGHQIGFNHSASLTCKPGAIADSYPINRSCSGDEYGDAQDFMSAARGLECVGDGGTSYPMISVTQLAVGFGLIKSIPIKNEGTFTVNSYQNSPNNLLYSLATSNGVAYFEFKTKSESFCFYSEIGNISTNNISLNDGTKLISEPSLQVRLVGNDQYSPLGKGHFDGVAYNVLTRNLPRNYTSPDGRQEVSWSGDEPNFRLGESIIVPNTQYKLTVTGITEISATFKVEKV